MGRKIIITESQLKRIIEQNMDDEMGVEYDDYDDNMERNMGVDDEGDEDEIDYVEMVKRVITPPKNDRNKLPGL